MVKADQKEITVEVAYVNKRKQFNEAVNVPTGATLMQALNLSGLLATFPELDPGQIAVGIYGKKVATETVLNNGDRVEVYRPLEIDPKEARRARAARNKR